MDSQNIVPNLNPNINLKLQKKIFETDTPTEYDAPIIANDFTSVYKDIDNISNMPLDTKKEVAIVLQKGWTIMRQRKFNNKNLIDLSILQITNINNKMDTVFNEAKQKIKTNTFNQHDFTNTSPNVIDLKNAAEPYYDILLEIQKMLKKNQDETSSIHVKIDAAKQLYKNNILTKTDEYTKLLYSKKGGNFLLRNGKRLRKGKRGKTLKMGKRNKRKKRKTLKKQLKEL